MNYIQHFKKGSDFITGQLYPTLSYSVPVYNYLIDKLEDTINNDNSRTEIKNSAKLARDKILEYYPLTDGHIYVIATGQLKLNIFHFYIKY